MLTHFLYVQVPCMCVTYQGPVFPVLQSSPCPPKKRLPLAHSGTACFLPRSEGAFNAEAYTVYMQPCREA